MDNLKKQIHIIFVSDNQQNAINLLNSILIGATTDGQEWTLTQGDFDVKAYIKYPGKDVDRKTPEGFLDFLITQCASNSDKLLEITNYIEGRQDSRYSLWIEETESDVCLGEFIKRVKAEDFQSLIKEYIEKVTKFNEQFESLQVDGIITGENLTKFMEQFLYSDKDKARFTKDNKKLRYAPARKLWGSEIAHIKGYSALNRIEYELSKICEIAKNYINEFIGSQQTDGKENNVSFDFSSVENPKPNGIGIGADILLGEHFTEKFSLLPLTIRDNVVTASIELLSSSPNGVDAIYDSCNALLAMAKGMGLYAHADKYGVQVSFRKTEKSVFIDASIGGVAGDFINSKINELNVDVFKLGLTDTFSFITDVNFKDVYENFSAENILSKVCNTTISGKGKLINIRSILKLMKDISKHLEGAKKTQIGLASLALKALSTFEKTDVTVHYSSTDIKEFAVETGNVFLGEEAVQGYMMMADSTFGEGILPMVLDQMEGVKPMVGMFGEGPSHLDLDKISVQVILPSIKLFVDVYVLLPGLTEFLKNNLFS